MWVAGTEATRMVQQAAATMAIENMYLSEEFGKNIIINETVTGKVKVI